MRAKVKYNVCGRRRSTQQAWSNCKNGSNQGYLEVEIIISRESKWKDVRDSLTFTAYPTEEIDIDIIGKIKRAIQEI